MIYIIISIYHIIITTFNKLLFKTLNRINKINNSFKFRHLK